MYISRRFPWRPSLFVFMDTTRTIEIVIFEPDDKMKHVGDNYSCLVVLGWALTLVDVSE